MTLQQLTVVLRARWRSVVLVWAIVFGVVVAATMLATPEYTAKATVLLDIKTPDPIAGIVLPGMSTSSYMATQIDVMRSDRVALRAISALGLGGNAQRRQDWLAATGGRGDFSSWIAEALLRQLEVRPAKDSNVLDVSYRSPDPEFSAAVANAVVQGFIDTTLELRVEPARDYNAFFDERAKQLRRDVEDAQAKLSQFQRSNEIIATDERMDIENARLSELSTQLVQLQEVASESGSRQNRALRQADSMQEVLSNPLVASLSADLARQEARLDELRSRLGEENPQVLDLSASSSSLRKRVALEIRRVAESLGVNNSVNEARVSQLRALLSEQRIKVLRMKGQRDEAAVLSRDVENAQRTYDSVRIRLSQTGLESQTSQTNVSVLRHASPPAFPSSPRVRLNYVIGFILALTLALVAAILLEFSNPRLRTEDDVVLELKQPFLGALQDLSLQSKQPSHSRLRLLMPKSISASTNL